MPSRYRRDAARLRAEIVARVAAGETVRGVCASPGMPSEATVRNWAGADAAFGEALAAARRRGTHRRLWAFDEVKAAAFLARARAGEPINALIGQPGMPSRRVYTHWNRTQPPFAEATFALRQRRDAQIGALGRARRRAFDPALADRIIVAMNRGARLQEALAADPDLPCWDTLKRWRIEQPEFDAVLRMMIAWRRGRMDPVSEDLVEAVVDHIVEGGTFTSFSRQPGAPGYGMLRRRMRDPDFAREVAQACAWREEWYADQILMAADRAGPGSVAEKERAIGALQGQLARLRNRPTKPLAIYKRRGASKPA